jgi:hypothetical protein
MGIRLYLEEGSEDLNLNPTKNIKNKQSSKSGSNNFSCNQEGGKNDYFASRQNDC